MWFSRPSDPPPDEALDADEREEVRSQAEEMGELLAGCAKSKISSCAYHAHGR